ncbi:hypothetical protein [Jiella pelagia]|uniref:Uncharacterized protein n=1 Tax=Jiella pelagia TaxID=2986949 RepID=A0ABY7C650_9HYPH|nr:hypothetical protein [Jiella pelagia]WAP69320.1 hypothetical protein OH818_03195 [Jiella pelagia]
MRTVSIHRSSEPDEETTMTRAPWCGYRDGIAVPGVGTVRLLDAEMLSKLGRGSRQHRPTRELAMAVGMSVQRFKRLSASDRAKVRWAMLTLTAPSNCGREPAPIDWSAWPADG